MIQPVIAIHGGAGVITPKSMTPEKEQEFKAALKDAVNAGTQLLGKGGTAVEAVDLAITLLEDCPYFNAGKGAVFNSQGNHEMDASFMEGSELKAGAVSKIASVRNPIKMARAVMEKSEAVLLSGREALDFAELQELKFEDDDYFFDQYRYDQWLVAQNVGKTMLDHSDIDKPSENGNGHKKGDDDPQDIEKKFGTVGAVALDQNGNLAAGTSTGGVTNKKFGRVGDSSIIGAGTYANNATCAVSCTGFGEYFIRNVAAYEISALIEYAGKTLEEACRIVIHEKIEKMGGLGGLIAVDFRGEIQMTFNTDGMYRAFQRVDSIEQIGIYGTK